MCTFQCSSVSPLATDGKGKACQGLVEASFVVRCLSAEMLLCEFRTRLCPCLSCLEVGHLHPRLSSPLAALMMDMPARMLWRQGRYLEAPMLPFKLE